MLNLSDTFKLDTERKEFSVNPLVVIDSSIHISTVKNNSIAGKSPDDIWLDRNLKLSSIKESIDLIYNKFKINNLSFTLSNFPINGIRFSDFVSERALINKYVEVYYSSQSCKNLADCLFVYRGTIRRFEHDDKIVKIDLEDITEDKLAKQIPIASTGFSNKLYSKEYLDKAIPICYGSVDKAPAMPWIPESNGIVGIEDIYIIADDVLGDRNIHMTSFGSADFQHLIKQQEDSDETYTNLHPLFIYKDDYYRVLQEFDPSVVDGLTEDDGWDWIDYEQYKVLDDYLTVTKKYSGNRAKNPPANNEFQCLLIRFPNEMKILPNPSEYDEGVDASEIDSNLFSVSFADEEIQSSELAVDNPLDTIQSRYNYITDTLGSHYMETHATIPSNELTLDNLPDSEYHMVENFRPYNNHPSLGGGIPNYGYEDGLLYMYQYEVTSWLWRYSHTFNNDYNNPTVSFIRLPSHEAVRERMRAKISYDFMSNRISSWFPDKSQSEVNSATWEIINTYGHLNCVRKEYGHSYNYLHKTTESHHYYHTDAINVQSHLSTKLRKNWCETNNLSFDWTTESYTPPAPIVRFNSTMVSGGWMWYSENDPAYSGNHNIYGDSREYSDNLFSYGAGGYQLDYWTEAIGDIQNYGQHLNPNSFTTTEYGNNYYYLGSYAHLCETDAAETGWDKPEGGFIKHPSTMYQSALTKYPEMNISQTLIDWGVREIINEETSSTHYTGRAAGFTLNYNDKRYNLYNELGYAYAIAGTETNAISGYNSLTTGHYAEATSDPANQMITSYGDPHSFDIEESESGTPSHAFGKYGGWAGGRAKYFNLFSAEDLRLIDEDGSSTSEVDSEGLFNVNDFPIFSPTQCTLASRSHDKLLAKKFTALWNGVSPDTTPDTDLMSRVASPKHYFFGCYQQLHSAWDVETDDVTPYQPNSGWFVWVRDEIVGIGGDLEPTVFGTTYGDDTQHENNINYNPKMIIPKNTILPCSSVCRRADGSSYTWTDDFGLGTILIDNPSLIDLNIGISGEDGTVDRRLGFVFPFKDIEISDNIKCDTFFHGKMSINFDTELTTDDSNHKLVAGIGAVDTTESAQIDWTVFDDNLSNLMECSLDTTIDNNAHAIKQVFSTRPEDCGSDINLYDFNNHFTTTHSNELTRIPQFHEPDNYNALTLIYKMQAEESFADPTVKSAFTTNITSFGIIHYLQFEAALDSPLYIDVQGRADSTDDSMGGKLKYTGSSVAGLGFEKKIIERPSDVIYHILEKEVGLEDIMNMQSLDTARAASGTINSKLAFSLADRIKAKDFINKLCSNTNLYPLFKGTSEFSFLSLNKEFLSSDITINSSDIIKYKFKRTPIENIHTIVNIKYNIDYATGEYQSQTGYVDGYDMYGNGDSFTRTVAGYTGYSYDYLGLEREDKIFEFEAEFIRDDAAAKSLRDFIYLWNCNQHNIFTITLPIKYLHLEVGDVISFDSLINNLKAYGEDYTTIKKRNEQFIYPYFIINSTDKKQDKIVIQATQLHELKADFVPYVGSISRNRGIKAGFSESVQYTMQDCDELLKFLNGGMPYFTTKQKVSSDLVENQTITDEDYDSLLSLVLSSTFVAGDLNADEVVNVSDIVSLINIILQGTELTDIEFQLADINNDGVINVVDMVALVNTILQE